MPVEQRRAYHHGDLARALVDEATALARAGGPDAVVLREATRRAGVSPTAAYRHFADRGALLAAVGSRARDTLADRMDAAVAAVPARPGGARRARARLAATGRAYVAFALSEPGLFRAAFALAADEGGGGPPAGDRAWSVLSGALDAMVAAGALPAARRPGADVAAWAAVHGLAVLLLDGAFGPPGAVRAELVERTVAMVLDGV